MINYVNIEYREHLGHFLNEQGLVGEMVEIGVMHGGYAAAVLSKWQGKVYHMVDPWCKQPPHIYKEDTSGIDVEAKYQWCCEMARKDKRIVIHRAFSMDAVKRFPDNFLDCVYIDGNHSYEAVRDDIQSWWPKVKVGGILGGHDYGNDTNWPSFCEVKRALDEWAINNQQVFVISRCSSWWIVKK